MTISDNLGSYAWTFIFSVGRQVNIGPKIPDQTISTEAYLGHEIQNSIIMTPVHSKELDD